MKISSRLREEAAVYCSAMACWWYGWTSVCPSDSGYFDDATVRLANHVYVRHVHIEKLRSYPFAWAEAEALLRTGWSP
jgi:hypothetical protein